MSEFTSYQTVESAPDKSQKALQKTEKAYGSVLNIFADMAESPLPLELYLFGQNMVMENGTLSKEEINIVQMAVSVENGCEFCVPGHTHAAINNFKTDDAVINAIRSGQTVPDEKFEALVLLTRTMVQNRGKLDKAVTQNFFDVGYTKEQVFEVMTIIAYKTITNYTSNLVGTKPNDFMKKFEWTKDEQQSARKAA